MCNISGILFGTSNLSREEISGKRVLEVGSKDVNGSLRLFIESLQPEEYIGIDIRAGKGVDQICDVERLRENFPDESFDVVIATELLEHVKDWKSAISNIKAVCKRGGLILLTTRSRGFHYHAWPADYWRFEEPDMRKIFSDCEIIKIKKDEIEPGVFVKLRKPDNFEEQQLEDAEVYCIVTGKNERQVEKCQARSLRYFLVSTKGRMIDGMVKFGRWLIKTG